MKFMLGKKIGMTQIHTKEGNVMPVTVIEAGPCFVVQIKTKEKEGYEAVQVGFEKSNRKESQKSQKGKEFKHIKEFLAQSANCKIGDKIDVSIFSEGDKIMVSGISKGKGFQGVVKRHGFKGSQATHGAKHSARKPGSIGSSFPEKVMKGKRMAGHMGMQRVSVRNLKIAAVDAENNLLAVSGSIPGPNGRLVEIRSI
jgi:large subunit ribosomal protein L3